MGSGPGADMCGMLWVLVGRVRGRTVTAVVIVPCFSHGGWKGRHGGK